jgi:acyl-CoA synthetase (AMP-forming)/AMP-acid ligase II
MSATMTLLTAGLATAAAATGLSMYLDAKYNIRSDIAQIRGSRETAKYVEKLYAEHGEDDWSFYHVLHATYEQNHHTDLVAFVFEDRSWTYRQFREEIGRLAERFEAMGIGNRTVVGMFVNNSPEFMFAWWALYKLGAIAAPINTAITGSHVAHCLRVSESEVCITTYELCETLGNAVRGENLPYLRELVVYDYDTYPSDIVDGTLRHNDLPSVTPSMADYPPSKRPKVGPQDAAQYLFTSGTTGMPKCATWPLGYNHLSGCPDRWPHMHGPHRRWYVCLPMFHGTASFAVTPSTLACSGTIILARRFSRRQFWSDIRRSKANAILYIGEMFRYLVQSPPSPDDQDHEVDIAFGLGLAPGVWRAVRERFGIDWIVEYYSASEATISLLNSNKNDFGVGKVARWGPILRSQQSAFRIVKADLESGELLRDSKGRCIEADFGEVGEAISKVVAPIQRRHDYVGEGGASATEKKRLRHVFENGDEWTRIGDALEMDHDGFISFRDRLGDTYRAKGHNISTTEVEAWLSQHPEITSVNVFAIPMNTYGYDGQYGCAAITLNGNVDGTLSGLEQWLRASTSALPAYAVPRFVRILDQQDTAHDSGGMSGDSGGARVSVIMKKLKTGLRRDGESVRAR